MIILFPNELERSRKIYLTHSEDREKKVFEENSFPIKMKRSFFRPNNSTISPAQKRYNIFWATHKTCFLFSSKHF